MGHAQRWAARFTSRQRGPREKDALTGPDRSGAGRTSVEPPSFTDAVARVMTEVLAPPPVIMAVSVVIGAHSSGWRLDGLALGLVLALFGGGVPLAAILIGVRRGRMSDHHISRREQRRNPLLIACASTAVGVAIVTLLGGRPELVATGAAVFVVVLVSMLVNLRWKMSIHSAVAAAGTVILIAAFGPWTLLAVVAVLANGWSRVRLGSHTIAQVVVGAVTGAVIAVVLRVLLAGSS
jgi:hypothetical protein